MCPTATPTPATCHGGVPHFLILESKEVEDAANDTLVFVASEEMQQTFMVHFCPKNIRQTASQLSTKRTPPSFHPKTLLPREHRG